MGTRQYSKLLGTTEDHESCLTTIVTREPMMQYVIDLLNNLCLNNGVRVSVAFTKPPKEFTDFFEMYFVSILPNVLRYKLYCGFIPWVVYQHPVTGDRVPMLLPLGSFSWTVRTKDMFTNRSTSNNAKRQKNQGFGVSEDGNSSLDINSVCEYMVQATGDLGVEAADIQVINLIDPMLSNRNTCMGLAQYSPLYVVLQKYLALDLAQQRRCYADDWNTTARLFTTRHPPAPINERAGRDEVPYGNSRFQQAAMPNGFFTYENQRLQYQNTSSIVRDALEHTGGRDSEHVPAVYSLPSHYNLEKGPELKPLQDIELLERNYRVAIAHILGIPLHVVDTDSGSSKPISKEELPFCSELVKNTCQRLTAMMSKVLLHMYSTVYHEKLSRTRGPVSVRKVRFLFEEETLYSVSMQDREDAQTRLEKPPPAPAAASANKK